jgi:hypothetical protein
MRFPPVKELFHAIVYILRHTLEPGMRKPVLGSVSSEREILHCVSGDSFVQVQ